MKQLLRVSLLIGALAGFIVPSAWAAESSADDALPLLQQARRQLQDGNINWLNYHIPVLTPEQREPLLYVLLSRYYQLRIEPPDGIRQWLTRLAAERPLITQQSTLDDFAITVPRYDYPALARAILRHWQVEQRQQQYARLLREGHFPWREIFRADNSLLLAQQQDVVHALGELTHDQLHRAYQQIQQGFYFPDNSVLAAIALNLKSPELLSRLFHLTVDQYSIDAALAVAEHFSPPQALQILTAAVSVKTSEMRYHALRAIVILAQRSPEAQRYLDQQRQHNHHLQPLIDTMTHQLYQSARS
ncbi:hypothetical protein [Celerinatantimonas sp. YJH-8]|uniref:hypothetical protein n=1 Tax=Celerinatantimonas sp. YJH-8 TaxID=3228714 RepID=UPI0038C5E90B